MFFVLVAKSDFELWSFFKKSYWKTEEQTRGQTEVKFYFIRRNGLCFNKLPMRKRFNKLAERARITQRFVNTSY